MVEIQRGDVVVDRATRPETSPGSKLEITEQLIARVGVVVDRIHGAACSSSEANLPRRRRARNGLVPSRFLGEPSGFIFASAPAAGMSLVRQDARIRELRTEVEDVLHQLRVGGRREHGLACPGLCVHEWMVDLPRVVLDRVDRMIRRHVRRDGPEPPTRLQDPGHELRLVNYPGHVHIHVQVHFPDQVEKMIDIFKSGHDRSIEMRLLRIPIQDAGNR